MISSRRRGAVWRWRCRRRSPPTRGRQADKFKEDIEASEVLSDDKKRELYNAYGHVGGISKRERRRRRQQSIRRIPGQEIDAEELFEAFFGMGDGGGSGRSRRNRGPRKGADLQMSVRITFQEAVSLRRVCTCGSMSIKRRTSCRHTRRHRHRHETAPGRTGRRGRVEDDTYFLP